MKRFISILLTLTMVLSMVCGMGVSAFADEEATEAAVTDTVDDAAATADDDAATADDAVVAEDPPAKPDGDPPGPPPEGEEGQMPPAGEDPGTEDPGTEDPGTEDPGTDDPDAEDPGDPDDADDPNDGDDAGEAGGYVKADGFVAGQNYILGIEKDGVFYAMSNNGDKTVSALATDINNPDPSVIWVAASGASLKNGEDYLYYDKNNNKIITGMGSQGAPSNWKIDNGTMYYQAGGDKYYVTGVDGDVFTTAKNTASDVKVVLYTNGDAGEGGSGGGDDQPSAPPDEGGGSDEDSGFNQKTTPFDADGAKVVFLTEDFRPLMFRDGALVVESSALNVTGDANSYHVDSAPPPNRFTVWSAGPNMTLAADDRGSSIYIYVDGNGSLQTAKEDDGSIQNWQKDTGPGSTDCVLGYKVGSTTYYAKIVDDTVTFVTDASQASTIYTLVGSGTTDDGPGGPGGGSSIPTVDANGPQIVKEPTVVAPKQIGSGYAAPEYTVEVALPEGSTANNVYFQWYIDDEAYGEKVKVAATEADENGIIANTLVAESLANLDKAGVHSVYVEVSCNIVGEEGPVEHTNTSITVNFIVYAGVTENSFLTFSDVHETFENIGKAINDIITAHGGFIPALIICTGDWSNGSTSTYDETLNTYLTRLFAQIGGIDVVFVSGNHDNGDAAAEYTRDANLGGEDFDGIGVVYDSSKGEQGTGAANDKLIVFGINYDSLTVDGGGYSYAAVLPKLESFLAGLKADGFDGLVVISAHAGLHKLDGWSGNAEYNVDKSDEVVTLLNQYGADMDIVFFFGHDHSKGESELYKVPGDKIESTVSFADKSTKTQTIKFTYGHAGYLTNSIGGQERYSYVTWNDEVISRIMAAAGGEKDEDRSYEVERGAGANVSDEAEAPASGTGWAQNEAGDWFYFKKGEPVSDNWVKVNGKWYHLDADGVMETGLITDKDGAIYYLKEDAPSQGSMLTGWQKIDGDWYYFSKIKTVYYGGLATGQAMTDGWMKINGKSYYFYADGKMAADTIIDGWYVGANGAWDGKPAPAAG